MGFKEDFTYYFHYEKSLEKKEVFPFKNLNHIISNSVPI